jgi:hypothetical protein
MGMLGALEIGIQKQEPTSDQKGALFFFGSGAAAPSTGEDSAPAKDATTFGQKWQAILGGFQASGEFISNPVPSTDEEAKLISASSSAAVSANGLLATKNRDERAGSKSSAQITQSSESSVLGRRNGPYLFIPGYLLPRSVVNLTEAKPSMQDSNMHLQKVSSKNNKSPKMETTADSATATSSTNPGLMLFQSGMPLSDSRQPTANPSGAVPSVREPSASKQSPFQQRFGSTATSPNPELPVPNDGARQIAATGVDTVRGRHSSSATSPPVPAGQGANDAMDSRGRSISNQLEAVAAQGTPAMQTAQMQNMNSDRESLSASAMQNSNIPIAPRDITFEQRRSAVSTVSGASKPETLQRNRGSIGEVAISIQAKTSAMRVSGANLGSQAIEDDRAEQFANSPAVNVAQFSGNASASTHPHLVSVHEPFVDIDSGTNPAAKWIVAEGHRAEAGFQDPSLGWVSVRAQAGAGGIHAAVVPASDLAAQVLGGHLAGLNAHLSSQYEQLKPVTLSTPDAGWNGQDAGRQLAQGNDGGASHEGNREAPGASEPVQTEPAAQFSHGMTEGRTAGMELQTLMTASNQGPLHVSFFV